MKYVGSRYVPKFMGQYDNTTGYDALSVVDNGMGTSYISGKPVPANTPLTDTNYWHIYGATNGAIINLQNQIDGINTDITNIRSELFPLTSNKILFVGDSYDNYITGRSWIDETASALALTGKYTRISQGGYGFNGSAGGPNNKYINLINAYSFTDPDDYTDVVILGGLNDTGVSDSDLFNDMEDFLSGVIAKLPNIKRFHIGFIGWTATSDDTLKNKIRTCVDQYRYFCSNHDNCHFIDNSQYIFTNTQNLGYNTASDKFHPVAAGIDAIVSFLTEYMKTGHADYKSNYSFTTDLSDAFTGTTNVVLDVSIDNSLLTIHIENNIALDLVVSNWAASGEKILFKKPSDKNSPCYSTKFMSIPFYGGGANMASASPIPIIISLYNGDCYARSYKALSANDYCIGLCTELIYPYHLQ